MKSNLFSLQAARVNQSTSVRFGQSACFSFDRNVHFMRCECRPGILQWYISAALQPVVWCFLFCWILGLIKQRFDCSISRNYWMCFVISLAPGADSTQGCMGVVLNTGTLLPLSGQRLTQWKITLIPHLELRADWTACKHGNYRNKKDDLILTRKKSFLLLYSHCIDWLVN